MNLPAVLSAMTATVHLLALAMLAGFGARQRDTVALSLPLFLLAAGALTASPAHAAPDQEAVGAWYYVSQSILVGAFFLLPASVLSVTGIFSRRVHVATGAAMLVLV